ncbi:MAG TPA: bifunctional 2-C-methyl-D-erythritol 4-phosphate cytidylyltransferase/2-C-methyl-D-erythritol 2,4-cyclodiphosphate synthase [Allosphingosinicella sp.]|uniref:bifunctional 2-C-methyl-D-erythritol 4-phosphate cytidylyltransferase/2-C-methyl-D-erythritol 2,4-cyclodiphosphate synthase n=1 Tax=Allosphingosinicella sp. TaxID=2823234 RepID=UPI002ED93BA1
MGTNGKTVVLVVAAGSGSRVGGDLAKQYRHVGGRPLLAHAVDRLRHPSIDEIRVVIGPGQEDLYREAIGDRALPSPITGGETRQQSVRNGLEAIAAEGGATHVLIHDAARAFLPAAVIDRLLDALEASEAAVPVLPVTDTLAKASETLGETVARDEIVRVQTPQAFRFDTILGAHRSFTGEATDDAQVARAASIDVATVPGDPALEKLTFPEDFRRMDEALLVTRTGLGFDVHAFAEGEELWLGGLLIPHEKGLKGHSDADVVFHAVTDALLGILGAGDIGDHFPPSDPQWRGASSTLFLKHAAQLIEEKGGRVDHIDVTIICEAPKIGPHKDAMRGNFANILGLPISRISVKATTTERLGFTGRGEGIAAQAIATVRMPEDQ